MSDVISLSIQGEIAVLKIENPPVNALSSAVRTELVDTVETMTQGDQIAAIVLVGDGRCFSAGADISEFGTTPPADTPTLPETIATLENATIPVVAGLHGFVLGGGLEVAMGAHYRIATPSTKLGLPEVDIGIIPGAGGTQRLPRLIGIKAAAHMVATAMKITGEEAAELGLVDIVTDTDDIEASTIAFAETLIDQGIGPRPTSMITDRIETSSKAKKAVEEVRQSIAEKVGGRQAPARALDSVLNAASMHFHKGMAAEREIFLSLRDGPEARALRYLFKAERDAQKISNIPEGYKPPAITSAMIIGTESLAQDIAAMLTDAKIEVTTIESHKNPLGTSLANVDLVVDATTDDFEIKKQIYAEWDLVRPSHAILATTSFDDNHIASATQHPDKVISFAPAKGMKLLEIVRNDATSPETTATMMALAKRVGKVGVTVARSTECFEISEWVNSFANELATEQSGNNSHDTKERHLLALINMGARLLEKGIVTRPSDFDVICRYGYDFPIWCGGPMFMADEMGLSGVLEKLDDLATQYGPAFEAAGLIREHVATGNITFTV